MSALSARVFASPPDFGDIQVSELIRVYDGDTFTVNLADWPAIIGHEINVRVSGADTPEIRGKCHQEKQLAKQAKRFTLNTLSSAKQITLTQIQRDKYFRILAVVLIDGIDLADLLIQHNLAVRYQGGKKQNPWC
ncbi:thermonuclease family protein [Catenovulum adriaticum]|uniref:Thermonuclease family protein n=1 Tax=Catenovulum adriaticum TaxID=2984846 RepID=A0ABY7APM6_9ALTE|nr:thermonuclease family protein [Catenovulum sp. TS8]WAJ71454.1 thermonuclease family protein [Catenovulum sp. TS8]